MKIGTFVIALALAWGLAPAAGMAATKTSLTATNNTIAGPGSTAVGVGAVEIIFSHPTGSDVCVTVVNTGKALLTVGIEGVSAATPTVAAGSTRAVCSDDTTEINLTCGEETNCAAQWRVDDN